MQSEWIEDTSWRKKQDLTGLVIRKHYLGDLPPLKEVDGADDPDATEVTKGLALVDGKVADVRIPSTNLEKRVIRFTLSTGKMDRQGDTVAPAGWNLKEYAGNGVLLWSHQNVLLPVGKNVGIGVVGKGLQQAAEYAKHQLAEDVFQLYAQDFLRAYSPGFQPTKWTIREKPFGFDFEEQILLESSCCNVPANPDALVHHAAAGAVSKDVVETPNLQKELLERLAQIHSKLDEAFLGEDVSYLKSHTTLAAEAAKRISAWL